MPHPDPVPARIEALLRSVRLDLGPYELTKENGARLGIRRHDGHFGMIGYLVVNPKHPSDGVHALIYATTELGAPHFCRFLRVATSLVTDVLVAFSDVDYESLEEPDDGG